MNARLRPRNEKMHELRHRRKAGPFDGGKSRPDVPVPTARDLAEEYGWDEENEMTRDKTSNSPNICGQCGARASYPERFTAEEAEDLDGVFNVCHECESECVGTGAWTDADRWIWAPAKDAQLGRKRLNAMLDDAEMAGMMREQMEDW